MNNSATGGYLSPLDIPEPEEDTALEDVLQRWLVGITRLAGERIRPRWQPNPPRQPEPEVNWCALGVTDTKTEFSPAIIHDGRGDGEDTMKQHEELIVLCSFYGPGAGRLAALFRDGARLPQNNEMLRQANMALVECGDIKAAPDLLNQQWVRRYDITATVRRQVIRTYQILNLLSAETPITEN